MPALKTLALATLVVTVVGLGCLGYAYFVEPYRLAVNRYDLRKKGWDPAFDGLRVALISDLHAGHHAVTAEMLRKIVARTNEEAVDAVFILGDHVSQARENGQRGVRMEPAEIAANLAGINSRYGVFVVLGNHDEWWEPAAVAAAFRRIGYRVLDGELAEIGLNSGQKLRILGLKDHTTIGIWKNYSDTARQLTGPTEGKGSLIALQHSPDVIGAVTGPLAITSDPMILFAGHTHGGQLWLPVVGSPIVPSSYGQKFAAGHVQDSGIDVFVTTGIGTSILPFRFLVPPEIAVVTIRSEVE